MPKRRIFAGRGEGKKNFSTFHAFMDYIEEMAKGFVYTIVNTNDCLTTRSEIFNRMKKPNTAIMDDNLFLFEVKGGKPVKVVERMKTQEGKVLYAHNDIEIPSGAGNPDEMTIIEQYAFHVNKANVEHKKELVTNMPCYVLLMWNVFSRMVDGHKSSLVSMYDDMMKNWQMLASNNAYVLFLETMTGNLPEAILSISSVHDFVSTTSDTMDETVIWNTCKEDIVDSLVNNDTLSGYTMAEADSVAKRVLISNPEGYTEEYVNNMLQKSKVEKARKSGLIQPVFPDTNLDDLAGFDIARKELQIMSVSMNKSKYEHVKPIMFVGLPGTGKTLVSEIVANAMSLPMVDFSPGRVMTSLVGGTEGNVRRALAEIKRQAPCVMRINEADKQMSGFESSNRSDAGVVSRLFNEILLFLEDTSHKVVTVLTANDVRDFPPEFISRMGTLFFTDLPSQEEREDIARIHAKKFGINLSKKQIVRIGNLSEDFSGREIVQCISRMYDEILYSEEKYKKHEPDNILIDKVFTGMKIPVSTTMQEKITAMRKWAITRTIPVSSKSKMFLEYKDALETRLKKLEGATGQ